MHSKASFFKKALLIGWLLIAAIGAQAVTYYVSPSGNDVNNGTSWALAKQTIQAGINAATSGDTILVADGTYGPMTISSGVTVRSYNGVQSTTIDGGGVTRCVKVNPDAVLDGFRVINGYDPFSNGGVYLDGGTVQNCIISNNTSVICGGVYLAGGTLKNCIVNNNTGVYYGGGVYISRGTVENCTIRNNTSECGGGVYLAGGTMENCTISGNTAEWGGGLTGHGNSTVENCTISGNTAGNDGGGLVGHANSTVKNCTISGNTADRDGGGMSLNDATVYHCTIRENVAYINGGGVCLAGGTVENCTISENTSYGTPPPPVINNTYDCGGGVYILGGGTVRNCAITENIAYWDGGGAFLWDGTLENCTISGNNASSFGGGVCIISGTVKNCMIMGNTADDIGGGVHAEGGTVENCTIIGNTVVTNDGRGVGGGVYVMGGTVRNCIAYYNQNTDVIGPISYSCMGVDIAGMGNITNAPQFVSTGTGYGANLVPGNYHLRPTSPCINAGINQSWMMGATDLDGLSRVFDSVVDMGAYECLGTNSVIMRHPMILSNRCYYGFNATGQTIQVWNAGTVVMAYALAANVNWLSLSPASGTSTGETDLVSVNYESAGLVPGTYTGIVTITSAQAINSPQIVTVYLGVESDIQSVADLEVSDLKFVPVNLWAGDHPAMISFDLVNEGPEDIVAHDAPLKITFTLSSNTTFGDEDDIVIGSKNEAITFPAETQTTLRYPGRTHNTDVTIPDGLSGDFYVFVSVQLASQSGLLDPDGAYAMRDGPIRVRIHPSDEDEDLAYHKVANDYDGDGQSDMKGYGESSGEWAIRLSGSGEWVRFVFGGPGYETVSGDYDGDGKVDPAIHQKRGLQWQIMLSVLEYQTVSFDFGVEGKTKGVVGDYDMDWMADPALYEEESGRWYVLLPNTEHGNYEVASAVFGGLGYAPVAGDYDGDGRLDPAVYGEGDPSTGSGQAGTWYVMLSGQGYAVESVTFGGPGYEPVVGDYDGDGIVDPMLYHEMTGEWVGLMSESGYAMTRFQYGGLGYVPIAGDYDGDGKTDPAVMGSSGNSSTGLTGSGQAWYFWLSGSGYTLDGPYYMVLP